jgi:extracellular factor (EF) 3-hydroxypalmitic acid methyl ester biosynthesis protein
MKRIKAGSNTECEAKAGSLGGSSYRQEEPRRYDMIRVDLPPEMRLARANESLVALSKSLPLNAVEAFHATASAMHDLTAAAAHAEAARLSAETIQAAFADAKRLHGESPFVSRLQTWPRGYPGDFETIEQLVTQTNKAPPESLAFWIEEHALSSAIAQQHRNKLIEQSRVIQETVTRICTGGRSTQDSAACNGARGGRILLIAGGSCPDLRQIQAALFPCKFEVVLNDADPDAIAFAQERLDLLKDRIQVCPGNIFTAIRQLVREEPFDAVVAGGLYDYLEGRSARKLTGHVIDKLLSDSGSFFFTNIAFGNPYRPWMEHLANWSVIERSEADLKELINTSTDAPIQIDISLESTGLTHLVHVTKGAQQSHPQ